MNVLSIIGRQEAELRYQLIIHITSTAGQNCVSSVIVDCASAMTTSRSLSLSQQQRNRKSVSTKKFFLYPCACLEIVSHSQLIK